MGITCSIFAAFLAAVQNYFLRRTIEKGGESRGFFVAQLTLCLAIVVLLYPLASGNWEITSISFFVGILGGILLGLFYLFLGKSFENGPTGLSVAVINSSSVVPAMLLALTFGASFGHAYSLWNAVGSAIVVLGFFLMADDFMKIPSLKRWLPIILIAFASHALYLYFLQWWAMMEDPLFPRCLLLPFSPEKAACQWFVPSIFLGAALLHWGLFTWNKQALKGPCFIEWRYGLIGGALNGLCMYFLILATKYARGIENTLIFPVFAVGIVLFSNIWARFLYKEKIPWLALSFCTFGIFVGAAFTHINILEDVFVYLSTNL